MQALNCIHCGVSAGNVPMTGFCHNCMGPICARPLCKRCKRWDDNMLRLKQRVETNREYDKFTVK